MLCFNIIIFTVLHNIFLCNYLFYAKVYTDNFTNICRLAFKFTTIEYTYSEAYND